MDEIYEDLFWVPDEVKRLQKDVANACSIETCLPDVREHYVIAQTLVKTWGSNVVAVILFVGENWLRGHKDWFPVIVDKMQYEPDQRRFMMMFNVKEKILCDFSTVTFCFGGEVEYDTDLQDSQLEEMLSEPTLKFRLKNGMNNYGLKTSVDHLIELFREAFEAGKKFDLGDLFGVNDGAWQGQADHN